MKQRKITLPIALVLSLAAMSAVTATAQINIKVPVIKPTTKPTPSPTGTVKSVPTTTSSGGGATREEVNAFQADLRSFVQQRMKTVKGGGKGIYLLKNMADQSKRSDFSGCGANVDTMRLAMDDGAAFAEIINAKYSAVENPTWTQDPDSMIGDWRRAVVGRNDVLKNCLSAKLSADLSSQTRMLREKIAKFDDVPSGGLPGFVVPLYFDQPTVLHARLAEKYKDSFALMGLTAPDDSVFAEYDAALNDLVTEAKNRASGWKWTWTNHDSTVENKLRSSFANFDKGTIVKTGVVQSEWEVNKNSLGIPTDRYKRAYVMYRKPGMTQCVVTSYSFEQDYKAGQYVDSKRTGFGYGLRLQNCN